MAILVSNPSTSAFMGLSADPVDPSPAVPEVGFTEELAVAMRPPSQPSEQGSEGLSASDGQADKASVDLQILPPDVLLNAVGDANFALAAPATQPAAVQDVPTENPEHMVGDVDRAAELAAAALAAQMSPAQAMPLAVSFANAAVSALHQVSAGQTVNDAPAPLGSAAERGSLPVQSDLSLQAAVAAVAAPAAGSAGNTVAAEASVESSSFAAAQTSAQPQAALVQTPLAVTVAAQSQTEATQRVNGLTDVHQALTASETLALTAAQEDAAPVQRSFAAAPLLASVAKTSAAASAVEVVAAVQAVPITEVATPVSPLDVDEVVAPSMPAELAGSRGLQDATALVAQSRIESASPMTGTGPIGNLVREGTDMPAGLAPAITVETVEVQTAADQVSRGAASLAEAAFKFDAKLGGAAQERTAAQPVQDMQSAPVGITTAMVRTNHDGGSDQNSAVDALASAEKTTHSVGPQSTVAVESSREKDATSTKSFDELSSTFVSSLVGGAPRPVSTVMDWVSLQPQVRPAAVEPHEVRLDAGAVQVEIQRMVKQGGGQVVMELTPPDQSKFTIELRLDERGSAHLVVEGVSDSTRTRLEQSAPQLHEQFQQMGLNLQLDMRQHRESASSGSQERAPNDTNLAVPSPELTVQTGRTAAATRAREAGGQVYLYA